MYGAAPERNGVMPPDAHATSIPPTASTRSLVKHGLVCSGDIFVSRPEDVERIKALYPDVDAVDMESGAIAQVCYLNSVPFACMRVISDTPGADDNIAQYENFWEEAPKHTFDVLRQVIHDLTSTENNSLKWKK